MKKIITLVMIGLLLTASLTSATANAASYNQAQKAQTFISNQIKGVGLIDSYQEDKENISYVYDNALAAMACMSMNNYGLAERIFDGLCNKVRKDSTYGIPYESYNFNGEPVNRNLHSGNAAWLLQALNIYQKKQSSKIYYTLQKKLADFLVEIQNTSSGGGISGGIENNSSVTWKSTEHNIISYVALRNFGRLNNLSFYVTQADKIMAFLASSTIWNENEKRFNAGENQDGIDYSEVTDVQALGTLLLGNSYSSALTYAEEHLKLTDTYNSRPVTGFDFNYDPDTEDAV